MRDLVKNMLNKSTSVLLILFFIMIFFPFSIYSQAQKKDPFLAAALSWFVPGAGQFYVDKPLKGSIYWLVDNALFWGTILNIADIKIETDVGFSVSLRIKRNLSSGRIIATVGLGVAYIAFHLFNVFDAVSDVNSYNQKIFLQELKKEGLSLDMRPQNYGIKYLVRF